MKKYEQVASLKLEDPELWNPIIHDKSVRENELQNFTKHLPCVQDKKLAIVCS